MLKQFQYTSIALLCSMAVACSSGGKGGQKPSPNQNPPRAEQPQPQPQPQAPRQEAQPDQAVPPKTDLAPNAPQQNGQADQPKAESEPKKDQKEEQAMPPVADPAPVPEAPQQNGQADQPKAESESQKDQKEEQAVPPVAAPAPMPEAPQQNGQADQPKAESEPQKDQQLGQEMPPKTDLAPNAPQQNGQADQPKAESEPQKDQQLGQEMPPKVAEPAPKQDAQPKLEQEKPVFTVLVQDRLFQSDREHQTAIIKSEDYPRYLKMFITDTGDGFNLNSGERLDKSNLQNEAATDVGVRLLDVDDKSVSQGFNGLRSFVYNPPRNEAFLLARDMDVNSWMYQSFGAFSLPLYGAVTFVSFGEESKTIPVVGTATYSGIALGSVGNDGNGKPLAGLEEIASNMMISADFGKKSLQFSTTNTKGFKVDGAVTDPKERVLDYSAWDLKGTATWNDDKKAFEGKVQLKTETGNPSEQSLLKGSFYGPNAAEIGGTFHLKDANKDYRGAFGGKKEEAPAVQGK